MIVLDTFVVSEILRGAGVHERVRAWLALQPERPHLTVITRAELLAGASLLPDGRRKEALTAQIHETLDAFPAALPFTVGAADRYDDVLRTRRSAGRPVSTMDALMPPSAWTPAPPSPPATPPTSRAWGSRWSTPGTWPRPSATPAAARSGR